jgi:hypothetical protein
MLPKKRLERKGERGFNLRIRKKVKRRDSQDLREAGGSRNRKDMYRAISP